MDIKISIDPVDMEVGDSVLDEDKYLAAIERAVLAAYPGATVDVQVGYGQGDEWYTIDGEDSETLMEIVNGMDTASMDVWAE